MLRYGFHTSPTGFNDGLGDYLRRVALSGNVVAAKAADSTGGLLDAQSLVKGGDVDGFVGVWRLTGPYPMNQGGSDVPDYQGDAKRKGREQFGYAAALMPPELDRQFVYIECVNEPDADNKERVDWMGRFCVGAGMRAVELGLKFAGPGWSGGTPDADAWELPGWQEYLRLCEQYPDNLAVALHEYSWQATDLQAGHPYLVGRFRFLHDACDRLGIRRPNILITEFGWAERDLPHPDQAIEELTWAGRLYEHENILGVFIWALDRGWGDLHQKANALMKPLAELNEAWVSQEQPVPEPPPAGGGDMNWKEEIWEESIRLQIEKGISLNPDALLQEAILADGLVPVHSEFYITPSDDGIKRASMGAESLDGSTPRRVYYAEVPPEGQPWPDPKWFTDPKGSPPVGPTVKLAVSPLSQRDPDWASLPLGINTGGCEHNKTWGNWGCLGVCYNMMANFLALEEPAVTPNEFNQIMIGAGAFHCQYTLSAALRRCYPNRISYLGYAVRGSDQFEQRIYGRLREGIPVPARVDFIPGTTDADQHWVLITGYDDNIPGIDILEVIFYDLKSDGRLDMVPYFKPANGEYGPLVTLRNNWGQGDETSQLVVEGKHLLVVKNAQFERRHVDGDAIYFTMDTSPNGTDYYTVESEQGWLPRFWAPGETFTRTERVSWFKKASCAPISTNAWQSQLLFADWVGDWTSDFGVRLNDVVEIHWVLNGVVEERYWYARGLGLVQWANRAGKRSSVSVVKDASGPIQREKGCFWA